MDKRIALKSVKYSAFASQETSCYQAVVYFDGRKACQVANAGHGGCDDVVEIYNVVAYEDMLCYINTLPRFDITFYDTTHSFPTTLESICSELLTEHLMTRDLTKLLKNRLVWNTGDKVYQTKTIKDLAVKLDKLAPQVLAREPVGTILFNVVPFDTALELYKKYA